MTDDLEDPVILRQSDIDRLEAELQSCAAKIEALTKRRDSLMDVVGAAKRLRALLAPAESREPDVDEDDSEFCDALVQVYKTAGRSLSHDEVKAELSKTPAIAQRLLASPGYFYTAISRLKKRGSIVKDGRGEYRFATAEKDQAPPTSGEALNGSGAGVAHQ